MSAVFDRACMDRALELAALGLFTTTPNPRVGCVIAAAGVVLGEGFHARPGEPHAEVLALADAFARGRDTHGATVYVTLEPCNHHGRTGPCVDALITAGIARVVAAMRDPNPLAAGGAARLGEAGIIVEFGQGEESARDLNSGFISRVTRGRPWVRSKIAASLDGRTALLNGVSQWITGPEARVDGHAWRARACAVLTGIGTILQDDPQLDVRDVATSRQPSLVIVDRHGQTPASSRALRNERVLIATAGERNPAWPSHVEFLSLPDGNGRVDLPRLMIELVTRDLNEVHVEAGAKLNGALLEAGMLDEMLVYLAPQVIGAPSRGMFERLVAATSLGERFDFEWLEARRVGADLRLRARRIEQGSS